MKFQAAAALAVLASSAAPAFAHKNHAGLSSNVVSTIVTKCFTSYNKIPPYNVPTSTTMVGTNMHKTTVIKQYVPTTTVTPAAITDVETAWTTVTTDIRVLSTATHTITIGVTDTQTSIAPTSTSTLINWLTTAIVSTSSFTTTIAAPSNFIPVESTLPQGDTLSKREPGHGKLLARGHRPLYYHANGHGAKKGYPQSVQCMEHDRISTTWTSTSTLSSSVTVSAATPTLTQTTTLTSLVPSFVTSGSVTNIFNIATLTTTDSITITQTPTSVITATSTLTQTTIIPAEATSYAQCGANNMVHEINGNGILGGLDTGNLFWTSGLADNALDCCAMAALLPNSAAIIYDSITHLCSVDTSSTCPNVAAVMGIIPFDTTTIMNGNCGGFTSTIL